MLHTGRGLTRIGNARPENGQNLLVRQKVLVNLFNQAGFQTILSKDILTQVWNKFIMNCVINPLTAVMKVRNGDLLDSEWSISLMRELYIEGAAVAKANGTPIDEQLWETLLQVCRSTSLNHSSMLQDIMNSKRTEIDSLNGSLLRIAEQWQISIPTHRTIHRLVKALE
ncbi:ketopantoate reductase family protein [Paenibacillus hexagrammi]|uniref:2-dehydropantoate 2-reductase n=1 Tax=Paenibacillus hexagrammi TaxID=2908839 RepID=A0ABY3SQN2_9BACL|nr:2-dehydropantoate 2-reductase [Paenibacillus sp. YPD9-1]UJF36299.1 2-dehydropantoate 2-reductase [Paenibacillus sp. YPD9-1]